LPKLGKRRGKPAAAPALVDRKRECELSDQKEGRAGVAAAVGAGPSRAIEMAARDDDTRRGVLSLFETVWKMGQYWREATQSFADAARELRTSDRHSWWPSGRLVLVRERRTGHLSRMRAANSAATQRNGGTGNHLSHMRCAERSRQESRSLRPLAVKQTP
jgi:hypothetical protein